MRKTVRTVIVVSWIVAATVAAWAGTTLPAGFEPVWPAGALTDLTCLAVSGAGTVVAGGTGSSLVVSTDGGGSWERVALPEGVAGIRALAWGEGRFVAVSTDGDTLSSTDGESWTVHSQDPALDWVEDVAWGGDRFVAVGGGGLESSGGKASWAAVASSPNGAIWTELRRDQLYYGVWPHEIAVHGDVLVAAPFGESGSSLYGVLVSDDGGRSWQAVQLQFTPDHVTATADGFYVLGQGWEQQDGTVERPAASSWDGLTWTRLDASSLGADEVEALAWTGGQLLAVGEWGTAESSGGVSWRPIGDPASAPRPRFGRLRPAAGVGLIGVGREETVLSLAGSRWQVLTTQGWPDLERIAASPGRLVAVGDPWLPGMSPLMGSDDGATWEPLTVPRDVGEVTDVVWTGERFVAAAGAWLLTSTDGLSWEARPMNEGRARGLWAGNGRVLAVGELGGSEGNQPAGMILRSSDGLSWEPVARVGSGLRSVACTAGGTRCVAVGWSGLAAEGTPDGSWHETYLADGDPEALLAAVATDGRRWVAAGPAGVYSSTDGREWAPGRTLPPGAAQRIREDDVVWAGDGFLAVRRNPGLAPWGRYLWAVRSLDGSWWGTAASDVSELDHVARSRGITWLLGRGGHLARALPPPAPGGEAPYRYLLPAVAHTAGLRHTLWRSDLFLAGRGQPVVTADLFPLADGVATAIARRRRIAGDFAETVPIEDLVAEGFGQGDATEAVLIQADGPLSGWSRTFTRSPDGGSYGQAVPLIPLEGLDPVQDLVGIEEDGDFRTDLGLVNAGAEPVTAWVEVRGTLGELLDSREITLAPFSLTFRTRYLDGVGGRAVPDAWIRVSFPFTQEHPHPPCLAFASVVDNHTGDPTLVLPQVAADGAQLVPVVVHLPGYRGTLWRSDLEVVNTGSATARFHLEYWPASGPAVSSGELTLAPGAAARYRDVVATLLDAGDKGALVVHAEEGAVAVRSRTYTVAPEGSYGQAVPAAPLAATARTFGGWIGLPVELGEDAPFRVSLGAFNPGTTPVQVSWSAPLSGYASPWTLQPHTLHQLDHALRIGPGGWTGWGPWVTSSFTAWTHGVTAYASIVDNRTGDPLFLPAQDPY